MVSETKVENLKGGNYGYYRRDDGSISCDEMGGNSVELYMRQGWVPLHQYGTYHMDHRTIHAPLDHLFRKGGAKELPVSQLIEESWAYPIWGRSKDSYYEVDGQRVEFPQLVSATIPPLLDCPFCERRGRAEQISNHVEVMHPTQFDTIQRQAAEQKLAQPGPAAIATAMTSARPAAGDYVCGRCAEGFTGHMALAKHVKDEHRKGESE